MIRLTIYNDGEAWATLELQVRKYFNNILISGLYTLYLYDDDIDDARKHLRLY